MSFFANWMAIAADLQSRGPKWSPVATFGGMSAPKLTLAYGPVALTVYESHAVLLETAGMENPRRVEITTRGFFNAPGGHALESEQFETPDEALAFALRLEG